MSGWDRILATQRQAKYPSELFVRFVARNYYDVPDRSKIKFLDLGCGAGANSWYLAMEGFSVTALDNSISGLSQLHSRLMPEYDALIRTRFLNTDINKYAFERDYYDCILDYNTLCHVEEPPYESIKAALKPDGIFFCVMPADDTAATFEGKGFCRTPDLWEVGKLLGMFSTSCGHASYPEKYGNVTSWVVEGRK